MICLFSENVQNFEKSLKLNHNSKWNKLYMKNYQKNPIYPLILVSCMLKQVKPADQVKPIKYHLNINIWSLNLNLGFKQTSFNLWLVALTKSTAYCHVTFMHHFVTLHWLCSLLFAGICSLSVDMVPTMRSMTPMKNYTIFRSARQAKPPCSFRYNPTLSLLFSFTALGQQWFICYLLR